MRPRRLLLHAQDTGTIVAMHDAAASISVEGWAGSRPAVQGRREGEGARREASHGSELPAGVTHTPNYEYSFSCTRVSTSDSTQPPLTALQTAYQAEDLRQQQSELMGAPPGRLWPNTKWCV